MDFYLFCLILGFAGLGLMAFSGMAAHGHAGHGGHDVGDISLGHGHAHAGHAHAGPAHAGHAHAGHGHHAAAHHHGHGDHDAGRTGSPRDMVMTRPGVGQALLELISPRLWFSVLLGMGAAGLLLEPFTGGVVLLAGALAGGLAFEFGAVRPLWNAMFRFASNPAMTLESAVMDRATAVTGFDAQGNGLVSIVLDGQIVQLLGTLRPEERALGVRVRAGDALIVEDVDGRRNRCVVSSMDAIASPK